MSNAAIAQRPRFSVAIQTPKYQEMINNTLQDPKRRQRFIASVTSAVAVNPTLQECDHATTVACALLGESLELSPSPQLGQYYLVPFEDKKRGCKVATFIIGYKGLIQLAIRSGQYKKLIVLAIKKGELVRYDPLNEEIEVNLIQDELTREIAETIGYYAMFEYVNGFKKALYWSKGKMLQHANRYSAAFNSRSYNDLLSGKIPEKDMWKYSSFWYKDFDGMAYKTMLRQLISKWGVMSIEMRTAFESDDAVINRDFTPEYVTPDTDALPPPAEPDPMPPTDPDTGEVLDGEISLADL